MKVVIINNKNVEDYCEVGDVFSVEASNIYQGTYLLAGRFNHFVIPSAQIREESKINANKN